MNRSDTLVRLTDWFCGEDTGSSSKAMAAAVFGSRKNKHFSYPIDEDDFGRCHRFLEVIPEARSLLPRLAEVSDTWRNLIRNWDDLTEAYLTDSDKFERLLRSTLK